MWNGEKTNDVYGYGVVVGSGPSDWDIQHSVDERAAARARKDWKESDRIRDELAKVGVLLKGRQRSKDWEPNHHLGARAVTACPQPKLAMRPLLPADVPLLAEIFRASIEELTADDYSEAQREAWAATADDEQEFGARLSGALTLVATFGGAAVGFASLADNRRIDMLYVHPAAAGQGAGAMLCDALEKLAAARGTKELEVEASDSARRFFDKRGFVAKTRNTISLAGEWLANTTMVKPLAAGKGSA